MMAMTQLLKDAQAGREAKEAAIQNAVTQSELRAAMAEQQAHGLAAHANDLARRVAAQNAYQGYVPQEGAVGPGSYQLPVQQVPQQGLGWATAMNQGYVQ